MGKFIVLAKLNTNFYRVYNRETKGLSVVDSIEISDSENTFENVTVLDDGEIKITSKRGVSLNIIGEETDNYYLLDKNEDNSYNLLDKNGNTFNKSIEELVVLIEENRVLNARLNNTYGKSYIRPL